MERRVGERFFAENTDDLLEVNSAQYLTQCVGCYYHNLKGVSCYAELNSNVGECWDRPENNDIVNFIRIETSKIK